MKTFIFLLCTTAFSLTTEIAFSQETVNIPKDQLVSVNEVFKIIKKQTNYRFIYPKRLFKDAPPVQLKKGEIRVTELIEQSLSNSKLYFEVSPKNVIIIKNTPSRNSNTQQQTLTGKVTDEDGIPLAGITIAIATTQPQGENINQERFVRGTVTDFDGTYTITGETGNYIVVSSLGYEVSSQQIVSNQNTYNFALKEKVSALDEIVVVATGYQTIPKERSAGSVAKANIETLQNRSTSTNVLERLDGLVPGLVISNAPNSGTDINGNPTNNSILIRGLNSINANRQPLFVVDGVPVNDVSRINPQDVENIYILKDATATSIYGARGSNGIIVITTTRGTKNNKLQIDYDSYINFQGKPDLDYIPRLNSEQFIQTAREIFDPTENLFASVSNYEGVNSIGLPPHEQILYDLDNGIIDQATADQRLNTLASFDNLNHIEDIFFRDASTQNHTLSARGGGEKHTFYASLSYTDVNSNSLGDEDQTYKININQDFKINKRLNVSLTTDLTNRRTERKRPLNIDGQALPYIRFRDAQGNNLNTNFIQNFSDGERPGFEDATGISLQYVPLDEVNSGFTKGNDFNARINLGLNVDIVKGLKFEGRYGYVHGNQNSEGFDNEDSYLVRIERAQFVQDGPIYFLPETGGHRSTQRLEQRDWLLRNQLSYNGSWKDNEHQLTVLLGQEAQESSTNFFSTYTRGYDLRLLTAIPVDFETLTSPPGVTNAIISNNILGRSLLPTNTRLPFFEDELQNNRISSWYGNLGYTYNSKYVLNASWRIDESNLFGIDKSAQNRPVWSVGGKWNIGNELFLKSFETINDLAFRVTYGITGNSPVEGTSSSFDILLPSTSPLVFNNRRLSINTAGNKRLTWERTETINVGLDFKLFNSRLNGSIDYYNRKTEDLIGFLDNNILTGFPSLVGNLGDMENTGIELSLNSLNIGTEDFSWITGFNLAYNKNTITRLNTSFPITTAEGLVNQRFVEGQSAFAIYAFDFVGLDNLGDPQIRLADGTITKDPTIASAEDAKFVGTYVPKVTGGLSNTFQYKGFSLNANMVYSFGAVLRADGLSRFSGYSGGRLIHNVGSFTSGNIHPDIFNRWKAPGDEAITNIPSHVANRNESNDRRNVNYFRRGDINVLSADYIKLRDITLAYSFPEFVVNQLNADAITFRLQVSNVMLWRKNDRNIDPEFHDAFRGTRTNIVNQETITAGVHITF